jgi:hypothetical protein
VGVVIGVGGFLGIGTKNVAIDMSAVNVVPGESDSNDNAPTGSANDPTNVKVKVAWTKKTSSRTRPIFSITSRLPARPRRRHPGPSGRRLDLRLPRPRDPSSSGCTESNSTNSARLRSPFGSREPRTSSVVEHQASASVQNSSDLARISDIYGRHNGIVGSRPLPIHSRKGSGHLLPEGWFTILSLSGPTTSIPLNFVNTHWSAPCEGMNLASEAFSTSFI